MCIDRLYIYIYIYVCICIYIYIYNTVMYIEPAGRRAAFQGLLRVR